MRIGLAGGVGVRRFTELTGGLVTCIVLVCAALIAAPAAGPGRQAASSSPASGSQASAGTAGQSGAPSDADANEYKNYRLNMNNVTQYVTATKAILKVMNDDPEVKKQLESQRDVPTIDEAVKTTEKFPAVTAAIETTGLTTRDYVVISGTLMGVTMAVGMKRQGQIKAYPTTVLPENVAFVEKNYEKLNSMMKALRQASGDDE
jgi:hypothetical protein